MPEYDSHLGARFRQMEQDVADLQRRVKGLEWLAGSQAGEPSYTGLSLLASANDILEECHTLLDLQEYAALRERIANWRDDYMRLLRGK